MIRLHRNDFCLVSVFGLAVALSACASKPELTVERAPLQPTDVKQVQILTEDADPRAVDAVRTALEAQGASVAETGWLVEAALAVRPVTVGGFSDAQAQAGEWTEAPRRSGARRGRNLHTLTVVMSQIEGAKRRTAQVSARHDDAVTSPELLAQLAASAADAVMHGHQPD